MILDRKSELILKKWVATILIVAWVGLGLVGCSDNQSPSAVPVRSPVSNVPPTFAPTPTVARFTPTATPQSALLPTATPPPLAVSVAPTRFPTVTARPRLNLSPMSARP